MIATSSQMDKIRKQAYDEGFQSGLKDGVVAGKEEYRKKLQHIEKIIQTLNTPLADLDGQVIDELVRLAMTIARHMIRREIKADPGEVVGVVREALGSLPVASRNICLYLHPEDAILVREALSVSGGEQSHRIVEDPAVTRGGCRVVTDTSQVDATLEKRLAALVIKLMGGERETDGNA